MAKRKSTSMEHVQGTRNGRIAIDESHQANPTRADSAARLAGVRAPAFNDAVRCVLIKAGWTPDRLFDSAPARAAHVARGLVFHPAAERFVRSFGGLSLPGLRGKRADPGTLLLPVEALAAVSD